MGSSNETLSDSSTTLGKLGRLVGRAIDDRATKVSLGASSNALQNLIDLRATQVSLGSAKSALQGLIDLKASQLSLGSAESTLEGLINLRATQVSLNQEKESLNSLINLRATEVSLATDKQYLENLINNLSNETESLDDRIVELEDPVDSTQGIVKDSFQLSNGSDSWYIVGTEKSINTDDPSDTSAGVLIAEASAGTGRAQYLVNGSTQASYNYPSNPANAPAVEWNRRGKILRGEYEQTYVITLNNGVFIDGQVSTPLELAKRNTYIFDWSADLTKPVTIEENGASFTNGLTTDVNAGTTTFIVPQDAPSNLNFVIDGTSVSLDIKRAPFHSFADTEDRINYNLLDVLSSKKTTKTNKVLVLTDTTANDYQFWTNTPYIFEYWKAIGDNKDIDVEFVGINAGDCPLLSVSSFHNYRYKSSQNDAGWALMSKFETDYGGIPSIESFFTSGKTASEWATYLNQYDSVIYYAFNKYAYFPQTFIDSLAEFREQGGGLFFNSGWRYYIRAVNPVLKPYEISFFGGPVHYRHGGVSRQPQVDEATGLFDYSDTGSHFQIGTLRSNYGYTELYTDINDSEYFFAGSNSPYIAVNINSASTKDLLSEYQSFLDFVDTPTSFDISKRNLKVNASGDSLEFVSDNFVVDGEFRGMMGNLLFHRNQLLVTQGEEYEVTNVGANNVIWRTANNTIRQFTMRDEYGQGGNDYYIRIDDGEPTCTNGASYDPETNSCFPNTEAVVPASNFQNAHNPTLSGIASGSHAYSGRIRILKTGYYSKGWVDVHQIYNDVIDTKDDVQQNQSDIASIQTDVQTLQAGGVGGVLGAYSLANLPINASPASVALVTDGSATSTPAMGYFYDGKWYRTLDNSLLADKTVEIYLLAGQSNAHGHAVVSDLAEADKTQDGLFYTSWHQGTSNASSTQYYSSWATSLIAGYTRGDSNDPSLGVSSMFGPELGFVNGANANNLTNGQPIGILKHAIGASALTDETHIVSHNGANYICIQTHQGTNSTKPHYVSSMPEPNTTIGNAYWDTTSEVGESVWSNALGKYNDKGLSDWDLTDVGDKRGDALRAFKLAIADGLTKLTNAGYAYKLSGLIWWQGESGGTSNNLIAFINHIRTYLSDNGYLDMPKAQFPFVITGTDDYWGRAYEQDVARLDAYVGFVNTQDLASPDWADRTLVHPGSNEVYTTDQDDITNGYTGNVGDSVGGPDFNNDGVNDMFAIGQAYADQMIHAKAGTTSTLWTPDNTTTEHWVDANDTTTITELNGNITAIAEKNGVVNYLPISNATVVSTPNAINGKNALVFDGDADCIEASANITTPSATQDWYIVAKPTINNGQDSIWSTSGQLSNTLIPLGIAGSRYFKWFYHGTPVSTNLASTNQDGVLGMYCIRWDTTNQQVSTWFNGNLIDNAVTPSVTINMHGKSLLLRHMAQYGLNHKTDGTFCESIITTSTGDREKYEGYLAHKWGLDGLLPSTHTYKNAKP